MKLPVVQVQSSALPPLYARWMESLLPEPIPEESHATCDDCAMCAGEEPRQPGPVTWFNPATKCCTYLPRLSNFTIGRILLDNDKDMLQNRHALEERLRGLVVSPFGLLITARHEAAYREFSNHFGQSDEILCPHYLPATGRCGIWRHRNAVCSTWFCKHVRGSVGKEFWRTLMQLLSAVERELEMWCVRQLNPGEEAMAELFSAAYYQAVPPFAAGDGLTDLPRDSTRYKTVWGRWLGREREFYEECGRLVGGLSWEDVLELAGQQVKVFARNTVTAYERLISPALPAAVRMARLRVESMGETTVRLETYSPLDPVDLPRELFDVLNYFDGRPMEAALGRIGEEAGLEVGTDLVGALLDFGILEKSDGIANR